MLNPGGVWKFGGRLNPGGGRKFGMGAKARGAFFARTGNESQELSPSESLAVPALVEPSRDGERFIFQGILRMLNWPSSEELSLSLLLSLWTQTATVTATAITLLKM